MSAASKNSIYQLYSIGHGNKSSEAFLALLKSFQIEYLADVRSYPSSKRNPHFNRENLQLALDRAGISYGWFPDLGGFRREGLGSRSPHIALKSPGFRNYADYMSTKSFSTAADKLSKLAASDLTCIMCAETIPQRCHRFLLSDYLLVQGCEIIHILDHQRTMVHQLSYLATVSEGRIIYNRSEPQKMEMKPHD
ncbi:MAG: DUF488 domain-containing protein [Syntrophobacterales bacterium]|jgi:uncharacterized protein (DUF488 family)